jgi:hypothetical protein
VQYIVKTNNDNDDATPAQGQQKTESGQSAPPQEKPAAKE